MIKDTIIELTKLIHLFHDNIKQYKTPTYDEANTRVDFIDKFFELLDWDVRNTKGYSESYREVVREDKVIVEGKPKAPDYSFRIGGRKFFFVEAKKPCVNIKEDRDPAFQLRRYGYTAKLSLSILTDFEEFAVYDTRIKPCKTDKASAARVFYCEFIDLLKQNTINPEITNFEYIYSIFSKNAILKGSFDRYIDENKKKKGTSEVDKEILKLIDNWRCELARNIALRNKELDVHNLNLSVQKIIDRIIFLRIAEDRNMEKYGSLQSITKENDVYKSLISIFLKAENKYNSGLFTGEKWLNNLAIGDKVINSMINSFYYPECPYELSILPIEILGNTYEKFLGKKIRLTASHQAKIEEKPEVRKAGGVYYTPQYIVDYIVENTAGEKVKRKKPEDIKDLTILDPACGSGSFLVRAYDFLLKHHIKYYCQKSKIDTALKKGKIYQVDETTYYLSTSEKQNILLNNIYGVDIDEQAVEVTKLSLLLKLMENENVESKEMLFKHSDLKLLPDLSNNIKCGNSLIGSDFYDDKNLSLFDKEEMRKVNVFDWDKEFSDVFEKGGFDCVVGNPPYGIPFNKDELKYFSIKYEVTNKFPDSYCIFMYKGIDLANNNSLISYIVPNTFCDLENCDKFRYWLLTENTLKNIWQTGWAFKSAIVDTIVFKIKKVVENNYCIDIRNGEIIYARDLSDLLSNNLYKIDYRNTIKDREILHKILSNSYLFEEIAEIKAGVKLYEKGKGTPPQTAKILKEKPFTTQGHKPEDWKQLYRGKHINRYKIVGIDEYVKYGKWLAAPRTLQLFKNQKILMRRTDDRIHAVIDNNYAIAVNSCHIIKLKNEIKIDYKYVLGILNSKLMQYLFMKHNPQMINKVFAEIKVIYVLKLPFPKLNIEANKNRHNRLVLLVDQILETHKEYNSTKIEADKKIWKKKIDVLDRQIDNLVYELYELTPEEIKIVEENV